jgi:hypothetical protein
MGLILNMFGNTLGRAIRAGVWAAELAHEIADEPFVTSPVLEGETLVDEGPDDLWPHEEYVAVSQPSQTQAIQQWGLCLPSGEVHWNAWQGIPFGAPLDRVKMVATLQKTAVDIGLAPGEQTEQFLARYHWVTRTVVYEDTGVYSLADPDVSALDAPEINESPHAPDSAPHTYASSANGHHPHLDICPGSVGGDAQ